MDRTNASFTSDPRESVGLQAMADIMPPGTVRPTREEIAAVREKATPGEGPAEREEGFRFDLGKRDGCLGCFFGVW